MEIYLVRHPTPAVEKGICYGQTDLGLTDSFKEKVESLKLILSKEYDVVVTSPLNRCARLAKEFSSKPKEDKRLMEMNFGEWEMKKWNDIPFNQLNNWMADFTNVTPPSAEPFSSFTERVINFYLEILDHSFERVLLITHAGVIRVILAKI